MAYHWRWEVFLQPVPTGDDTYLGWLLAGLKTTLIVSLPAWIIALAVGAVMGVFRTVPNRVLYALSTVYVEVFRNIPLLVQLFIWYFVIPELMPERAGLWVKGLHPFLLQLLAGIGCLAFFTGARVCEQVRAGIDSLAKGQRAAALAMGFTLPQAYRYVLLPAAARIIVPPLTSEFLNIVKNSSVASTIALLELAAQARQLADYTAQPYESFIAVTLLYPLVNSAILALMRVVEARTRVPGFIGARK